MPKLPINYIVTDAEYDSLTLDMPDVQRVLQSIQDFGEPEYPIIVQRDTNKLIDGRKRYLIYKQLGKKTIDVIYKNYPDSELKIRSMIPNLFREQMTTWQVMDAMEVYTEELKKIKGEDHPMFNVGPNPKDLKGIETPSQLGMKASGLGESAFYDRKNTFNKAIPEVKKVLIEKDYPLSTAKDITAYDSKEQKQFIKKFLTDAEFADDFNNAKHKGGFIYRYINKDDIAKHSKAKKKELEEKFQVMKDDPHRFPIVRSKSQDYASSFLRKQKEFLADTAFMPMMIGRRGKKLVLIRFTDPETPFTEAERTMLYDLFNITKDMNNITIVCIEPHPYDSKLTKGAIVHTASREIEVNKKNLIALCKGETKKGSFNIELTQQKHYNIA